MAKFAHMVYFTLKDNSPKASALLVAACEEYLSGHPGTEHFSAGIVADKDRDVNDRDFDVSLHLVFESVEAHDAYQVADRHATFIAQQKDNWQQVRVFDSVIL